jgi:hypothetical protein
VLNLVREARKGLEMKLRNVISAVAMLACGPLAAAGNNADYPKDHVAQFVFEKLDVNSLPAPFRPKKQKGKKTFADYGYTTQKLNANEAVIEAPSGAKGLAIAVLDQNSSGIYVCVTQPAQNNGKANSQNVLRLKRNEPNALLKGRESFREFSACPVIGGDDSLASGY